MALDGIFLNFIKKELEKNAIGARVEKVHQPARQELVFAMRSRSSAFRLLFSCSGNAPRLHKTTHAPDNPQNPPMLCMFFRKQLLGAILERIRQEGLDRVLFLDFNAITEIGDRVKRTLVIEIMAQHSNIILLDENGIILESIKHIDSLRSSVREVLPGIKYVLPPAQDKLDIRHVDNSQIIKALKEKQGKQLSAALLLTMQGMSPILCREIVSRAYDEDIEIEPSTDFSSLELQLNFIRSFIEKGVPAPSSVSTNEGKMFDFSFLPITQYGSAAKVEYYDSPSELLDRFYYEQERFNRIKSKAKDLFCFLNRSIERTTRKIGSQQLELKQSENREEMRIFAELIQANLHKLEKGSVHYVLENYYDNYNKIKIPVKPDLSPVQNSQWYYKQYRKAQTAEKVLAEQIKEAESDLTYLNSVLDLLSRSETEAELAEIRAELQIGGYLKKTELKKAKNRRQAPLPPLHFNSPDGFSVYVGRNNLQNDRLSLKMSKKTDLWFHAQKMPGSHVVLSLDNKEPTSKAIEFAASLAAYYSSGRQSGSVPVDYTEVSNLKKPKGSKPGFVIYHIYNSIQIAPAEIENAGD